MAKKRKPGKSPRYMAEGGEARERVHKAGLADPRTGGERVAGMINRVASGNRKAPVRRYDDDPATMRRNRAASRKR